MAEQQFIMSSSQIAEIMGTVGSPLIVVSELLKNAVDASATNIDIYYNRDEKTIIVENDNKGFTFEEIEKLAYPGVSSKKQTNNLKNEQGMFLTGSKGLGLLSVFLLCERAEIYTSIKDEKVYKIILDKRTGTVEQIATEQLVENEFTKIVLINVDAEIIDFLSSESEVRKLRHICTYLYKKGQVPFPTMKLHISGQSAREINFSCNFPNMLFDVRFNYSKQDQALYFCCASPDKQINENTVVFNDFQLQKLQEILRIEYGIKDTIPTRSNDLSFSDFSEVPNFEGRILVYERNMAGAQLKTYGSGVNIYVNEFALYNYLAEENDWLGLADYAMRKKITRLKPHNVFGYVNFPCFNENEERLKISNERADFIQDLTFSKLMYLLKGVVMFAIFNIDVTDKNKKNKNQDGSSKAQLNQTAGASSQELIDCKDNSPISNDNQACGEEETDKTYSHHGDGAHNKENSNYCDMENARNVPKEKGGHGPYSPESSYKPKKADQKSLLFTMREGELIDTLKGSDDLGNKIYNVVFELSKLDLQIHRHSIAYLYRALLESSTKYLSRKQQQVKFTDNALETSVVSALNYFGNISRKNVPLSQKTISTWRDTISKRKLIDTLNQYVHNEQPVDALLLQETWNTMKGYIIACLTIQ